MSIERLLFDEEYNLRMLKQAIRDEVREELRDEVRDEVKNKVMESMITNARNFLREGATVDLVARALNLPLETVQKLANEIN